MRFVRWLVAALLLPSAGACADNLAPEPQRPFGFEQGLEGWLPAAADTGTATGAHASWSIESSRELAYEGTRSLKLYLANNTDAAKIWVIRPFAVTPGRSYRFQISYQFASRDWGDANLFYLLGGVFATPPIDGPTLLAGTVREHTGNGASEDIGFRWLDKSLDASFVAGDTKVAYVVIGIWGTWEGARTYYVDRVAVAISPG